MSYSGRCACDAVKIAIEGEPVVVRQCWCRHCQQLGGGGATVNAIFPTQGVRAEGPVHWNEHLADSGNTLRWGFCAECGSQLFAISSARPQFQVVRLGAIDQPHGLRPQAAIWTAEAPEWAVLDPELERLPGQPQPPPRPG